MNEGVDRLLDALLREELGRERPPDLSARILVAGARQRHRAYLAACWPLGAAAVVVIGVALFLAARARTYPPPRAAGAFQVLNGAPLTRGVTLVTDDGKAQLELGGYCRLLIQRQSEVRLGGEEKAEEIKLQRGGVLCDIDSGIGTFVVQTDVGLVRVKGTRFSVDLLEKGVGTMSATRMIVQVLSGAVIVTGAWGSMTLAEGPATTLPPEAPSAVEPRIEPKIEPKREPAIGKLTGILVGKAPDGSRIQVKAEGDREDKRYIPVWQGGNPDQGGGFDKQMVETIKKLRVSNRVEMEWKSDEHLRVLSIKMVEPVEKSGTVVGTVTAKEKNNTMIEVRADPNGPTERYVAPYRPGKEGGLDKSVVAEIEKVTVGDQVRVEWTYNERKRAVKVDLLGSAATQPPEKR